MFSAQIIHANSITFTRLAYVISVLRSDAHAVAYLNSFDCPDGMLQRGTNWADGVPGFSQCPVSSDPRFIASTFMALADVPTLKIPAGKSFQYKFTVANQYGTYWYHSHMGNTLADGLLVSNP